MTAAEWIPFAGVAFGALLVVAAEVARIIQRNRED